MRAQLASLFGVQAPLKQRAEDGDVNRRPVQRGGVAQLGHVQNIELRHGDCFEQPAVEPRNVVIAVQPALLHGGKQVDQAVAQLGRRDAGVFHQAFKQALRQQIHIVRKEAKQALREKVRHHFGRVDRRAADDIAVFVPHAAARAQPSRQRGKALGRHFGDVAGGGFGAKPLGVVPQLFELSALFRLRQLVDLHRVHRAGVAGELGVDAQGGAVADDHQRRIRQRQAVAQQLLQRLV